MSSIKEVITVVIKTKIPKCQKMIDLELAESTGDYDSYMKKYHPELEIKYTPLSECIKQVLEQAKEEYAEYEKTIN